MEKISIRRYALTPRPRCKSRRKYVFTDQIDQIIREVYLNERDSKTGFGIRILAKKVAMPHWALKKRARELGLAGTKELPWSEAELGILERYAWMSDERIRLKLKAAGYCRTVTGIHLKLKRMRFKHDGSFYSARIVEAGESKIKIQRSGEYFYLPIRNPVFPYTWPVCTYGQNPEKK